MINQDNDGLQASKGRYPISISDIRNKKGLDNIHSSHQQRSYNFPLLIYNTNNNNNNKEPKVT